MFLDDSLKKNHSFYTYLVIKYIMIFYNIQSRKGGGCNVMTCQAFGAVRPKEQNDKIKCLIIFLRTIFR